MSIEDLHAEIKRLEQKSEDKKKDAWDKWQVIGTVLVPVALALAGYFFSKALNEQQTKSNQLLSDQQIHSNELIATNNLRVNEYQIVAGIMKSFLSADPLEKTQAINFVFILLQEDEARQLVSKLSQSDPNSGVRAYAAHALDTRLSELTSNAFAEDFRKSQHATAQLTNAWLADPTLTKRLLEVADQRQNDTNGSANAVTILSALAPTQLHPYSNQVSELIGRTPAQNSQQQLLIHQLKSKLQVQH